MDEKIKTLQQWIDESRAIVFFGGAGVSTESGIPDFRSVDGLYNQKYAWPPEEILSRTFFDARPEEFYRFYRDKMLCLDAQPNAAHQKLAQLEAAGKLRSIVTQNIDGLHQKAGSKRVWELHGSVHRNYCMRCRKPYAVEEIKEGTGVPKCSCGGTVKPDVVLYEESLDSATSPPTCSSSAGPLWRSTPLPGSSTTIRAPGWCSSTRVLPPTTAGPTWPSTCPSARCWDRLRSDEKRPPL